MQLWKTMAPAFLVLMSFQNVPYDRENWHVEWQNILNFEKAWWHPERQMLHLTDASMEPHFFLWNRSVLKNAKKNPKLMSHQTADVNAESLIYRICLRAFNNIFSLKGAIVYSLGSVATWAFLIHVLRYLPAVQQTIVRSPSERQSYAKLNN